MSAPGHIRFVLPGAWANVPLVEPDQTRKFVQRLVQERVGRDDRLASVRREVTRQMCDTAAKAHASGAHTLALALEIVPGVPFAASMVARDAPWPDDVPVTDHPEAAERLAQAFPGAEVVELTAGPATRVQSSGVLRGKDETTSSVSVHFRVPRPDTGALLHVRFTGPDMGRPDLIARLFDAVADSVEFTRARSAVQEVAR
ncbi:MAG: hypothetical protein GX593_10040 [Actinomycetales bacterium]|nr:hypothetical protein [Actinomycetales bacterium]